ncbi:uncharacterized protein EDB93DRAFT_543464 [Suillus bovinus]|uniref:uncharacterized protein n=1 Tax=Suillus bovinus TaxID=48563 RepID=UPI001B86FC12|nr:uncharacterized protein EDB93DRAFT_543464 [Suillus bovinus]KAG2144101.1 hypothetical protein EDB93DRAFT_543464 [Suillus bovinus]
MAPECLALDDDSNESAPVFSPKSDVYSFGRIMLQVLEGKVPYHYISNQLTILAFILRGTTPKKPPTDVVGDSEWNFIQSCWLKDMERRPSDEDILSFVDERARTQS